MKHICVSCSRPLIPKKNGVYVVEMAGDNSINEFPYRLWMADLWECPECKNSIITGFGAKPISEHFEPSFKSQIERIEKENLFYTI